MQQGCPINPSTSVNTCKNNPQQQQPDQSGKNTASNIKEIANQCQNKEKTARGRIAI